MARRDEGGEGEDHHATVRIDVDGVATTGPELPAALDELGRTIDDPAELSLGATIDEHEHPWATPPLPEPRQIRSESAVEEEEDRTVRALPALEEEPTPAILGAVPSAPVGSARGESGGSWREDTELEDDPTMGVDREDTTADPVRPRPDSAHRERILRLAAEDPDRVFGSFVVLGPIGVGGMADVRLAYSTNDPMFRPTVLKRIAPSHQAREDYREMFREEGRIGRLVRHPNIVELYDAGAIGEVPYLAFELVDGVTLAQLLRLVAPNAVPPAIVCDLGIAVAEALDYAHQLRGADGEPLSLIHRDVTPQNILVARDGTVKLADFGIARFEGRAHETRAGLIKGKMRYLAPEQIRIEKLDGRTDLFALGVVMVELLSAQPLLLGGVVAQDDLAKLVRERLSATTAPKELVELLLSMSHERREGRPDHALAVVRALRAARRGLADDRTLEGYVAQVFEKLPALEDTGWARAEITPAELPEGPTGSIEASAEWVEPSSLDPEGPEDYPSAVGLLFPELFEGARGSTSAKVRANDVLRAELRALFDPSIDEGTDATHRRGPAIPLPAPKPLALLPPPVPRRTRLENAVIIAAAVVFLAAALVFVLGQR